jgi:hypothetical protein
MLSMHPVVRSSVLLACVATAPALAADWSFDPRVSVGAEYNDNNRLTNKPGEEIVVSGGELDALLVMSARTPTTLFSLTPRLRSSFYPGDESEETDDQFLRLRLRNDQQRLDSRFDANYSRIETKGSYFPTAQVGDDDQLGNPGTGLDAAQDGSSNREDRIQVIPGVSLEINERHALDLALDYLDVGYDREEADDRESYANYALDLAYRWMTTPTATVSFLAGYARYEPDGADSTDSYALGAEWANRWSETAEVYVRGGAYFVESAVPGDSGRDSGFSGGAGVRWSFEVTDIFLDANQFADPSSSGELVERTQLRFQVSRQLAPNTTVQLGIRGIAESGVAGRDDFEGSDYVTADLGLKWRMIRELTLFGGYWYRWKDKDNAADSAESNTFRLGVIWEPNRK